jgi:hypothetical protein
VTLALNGSTIGARDVAEPTFTDAVKGISMPVTGTDWARSRPLPDASKTSDAEIRIQEPEVRTPGVVMVASLLVIGLWLRSNVHSSISRV